MKKYVLIFGLLMIIFPCQSWSATYYVAQSSVGSGNGSSYANRMSVSSHNSSSFSAGDTIYLCGTITSAIYPPSSGANGNPIIYDGDCPSGTPVEVINTTIGGSIDFTTKDYLTFQDIEGHGGDTGLKTAGGSTGITIKRCKLYNYDCRGIFITTSSGNPYGDNYDLTIGGADGDGNEIYDCGTNTAGADISLQRVHDFTISYNKLYGTSDPSWGGIDGMAAHYSDDGIIEYNKIYSHNDPGSPEDGIDIKQYCNNIYIRHNDIYGHKGQTGITIHFDAYNIKIYGNRVYGNRGGILIFDHATSDMSQPNGKHVHDIKIWGNLIYDNDNYGIKVYHPSTSYGVGDSVEDVDIYNNVLANNSGSGGIYFASGGTGHSIKNNIFYKNRSDYIQAYIYDTGDVDMDYNYYYWPGHTSYVYYSGRNRTIATMQGTYGLEAHGADADQKMTDPDNDNYTLQSDSRCIDAGDGLGVAYVEAFDPDQTDFNTYPPFIITANQRDHGSWEIGAFIYKQSQDTTILSPPLGLRIPLSPS